MVKWFAVIWMLANDMNGISSSEVSRAAGVTQDDPPAPAVPRTQKSAILHEKRFGTETLLRRIRQFVTPAVGDLEMRDGTVRQRRTGAVVTHRVACALMMAYPRALTLATADQVKAAQRFREWLATHSTCVELTAKGNRLYELSVDEVAFRNAFPEDAGALDLDPETLREFEDLAH